MNGIFRFFFNLLGKLPNRALNTMLGGGVEVPLSARAGYWHSRGYRTGKLLTMIINALFFDSLHCQHAYLKEDDSVVKYCADPEGHFFWWLLLFYAGLAYWYFS